MLKFLILSVLMSLPLSITSGVQSAEAGVFANKPVRSFFQNRKPVRKLLKATARVAVAPVKFVAKRKPVRSALKAVATPLMGCAGGNCGTEVSAQCDCENCTCVDCKCGE